MDNIYYLYMVVRYLHLYIEYTVKMYVLCINVKYNNAYYVLMIILVITPSVC